MRKRFTGRISLLILSFAIAMLAFPAIAMAATTDSSGTTTSLSPTIQSDQADYPPSSTVNLTGSNWQPGETVHIVVNDTYGATWQHTTDVTADARQHHRLVQPAELVGLGLRRDGHGRPVRDCNTDLHRRAQDEHHADVEP